jgi:outer membrane protein assembly factor BamA
MAADQPSRGRAIGELIALALTVVIGSVSAARADYSFVPVPEFITDPNEGNTYGLMAVFMFLDENNEIQYLLAPDARYNSTKGFFPTFRLFGYPSSTRRYQIAIGQSTTKDNDYEAEYYDRGLLEGKAFLRAKGLYENDSTERFFGFGNNSNESNEANYTSRTIDGWVEPGYWVVPKIYVSYKVRITRYSVSRGQVSGLPFLTAPRLLRDPETNTVNRGLQPGHYFSHRIDVGYDTRDSIDLPTQGALSLIYFDVADRALGSSTSYTKFGLDARGYMPLRGEKKNPILAMRANLDYVTGPSDTPFWERSSLGGRRSLRGYNGDRFIGFNRSQASVELRTNVYQRRLFGVKAELELAPFVDTGQVFKDVRTSPVNDLHWDYGLGFRGIVRPQIVAFVDVAEGSEGLKVITGIDYPF